MVRRIDDLKTALVLSAAFATAAAATVPLLVPSLPPEARSLPLPLPAFCAALAAELAILYGLLGFAGLRLARSRGLEPAPELTAIWDLASPRQRWGRAAGASFAIGLGCGAALVAAVAAIRSYLPETLPGTLTHPGSPPRWRPARQGRSGRRSCSACSG